MDIFLYFLRDQLVGVRYFIYVFVCLVLMFSIIGYLFKQKYAKVEIKLNINSEKKEDIKEPKKVKESNNKKVIVNTELPQQKVVNKTSQVVSSTSQPVANNQQVLPVVEQQPIRTTSSNNLNNQTINSNVDKTNLIQQPQVKQVVSSSIPDIK